MILGNALHLPLIDSSIQCVVTSPPYWGLRNYGHPHQLGLEPTPEAYVTNMVQVFREVWRVLKDDGTVWLNLGDSYAGSWGDYVAPGSSKHNFQSESRWRRPGYEVDKHHNKPPTTKIEGLKNKDLVGIPWRVAFALQAEGWYLRQDIIWHKPNPMPESVKDRCTKAHEYLFMFTKSERYFYDADAIKEPQITDINTKSHQTFGAPGGKAEFVYGQKVSGDKWKPSGFRNKRSVWSVNTIPYPDAHFATFPEKLIEPCVLAGSRAGDMVFDPFVGSGTTVKVAQKFGRMWVGLDCNLSYLQMAQRRLCGQPLALPF